MLQETWPQLSATNRVYVEEGTKNLRYSIQHTIVATSFAIGICILFIFLK